MRRKAPALPESLAEYCWISAAWNLEFDETVPLCFSHTHTRKLRPVIGFWGLKHLDEVSNRIPPTSHSRRQVWTSTSMWSEHARAPDDGCEDDTGVKRHLETGYYMIDVNNRCIWQSSTSIFRTWPWVPSCFSPERVPLRIPQACASWSCARFSTRSGA